MKNMFKNPWAKGGEYYPEEVVQNNVIQTSALESLNVLEDSFAILKKNCTRERYVSFIKQGNKILRDINFGVPTGTKPGELDGQERYDTNFWTESWNSMHNWGDLVLLPDKKASNAISNIFNVSNLSFWALDCARFTDLLHIYANMMCQGQKRFDRNFNSSPFIFSPHDSSAAIVRKDVYRLSKSNSTYYIGYGTRIKVYEITEENLLSNSPIGNTIIFSNDDAPKTSAWRNENAIKIADDNFIAHGFGSANIYTSAALKENLAKSNVPSLSGDALEEYVKNNIYLKQSLWINFYG